MIYSLIQLQAFRLRARVIKIMRYLKIRTSDRMADIIPTPNTLSTIAPPKAVLLDNPSKPPKPPNTARTMCTTTAY